MKSILDEIGADVKPGHVAGFVQYQRETPGGPLINVTVNESYGYPSIETANSVSQWQIDKLQEGFDELEAVRASGVDPETFVAEKHKAVLTKLQASGKIKGKPPGK